MQKTVKEWLTEWEHPAAKNALMYASDKGTLDDNYWNSLSLVLLNSFTWEFTEEGVDYWEKLHKETKEKENVLPVNTFKLPNKFTETIQTPIGLSKRDYFAAMAMQGFIINKSKSNQGIVEYSVYIADLLIAELNNQTNE